MNKSLTGVVLLILLQILMASAFAGTYSLADKMFKDADSADIREDYRDASAKYLELISALHHSDPSNILIVRARARLARIYILQKQFDKANELFMYLMGTAHSKLQLDPELMIDLDDLSDVYLKFGSDPHYGYESMKRCLSVRKYINPNHPHLAEAYRHLSQYCSRCSNFKEASEWMLKAIEIDKHSVLQSKSDLVGDKCTLADTYMNAGELDKAQQTAKDDIDLIAKCACGNFVLPQLHATLGHIYTLKGLFDLAELEFKSASKISVTSKKYEEALRLLISNYRKENERLRKNIKVHN